MASWIKKLHKTYVQMMNIHLFGQCMNCGHWTHLSDFPSARKHDCDVCGKPVLTYYEERKLKMTWYKPWTWNKRQIISHTIHRKSGSWCTLGLPGWIKI